MLFLWDQRVGYRFFYAGHLQPPILGVPRTAFPHSQILVGKGKTLLRKIGLLYFCLFQVKQKYLEVAKRMKEYEDVKYDQWRNATEERLPILLKKTLLARVHPAGVIIQSSPDAPEPVSIILSGDRLSLCPSESRDLGQIALQIQISS